MASLNELARIAGKSRLSKEEKERQQEEAEGRRLRRLQDLEIVRLTSQIEAEMMRAALLGEDGIQVLSMIRNIDAVNPDDRRYFEEYDEYVFNGVFEYCQKKGWNPQRNTREYYGDTGIFAHNIYIYWVK